MKNYAFNTTLQTLEAKGYLGEKKINGGVYKVVYFPEDLKRLGEIPIDYYSYPLIFFTHSPFMPKDKEHPFGNIHKAEEGFQIHFRGPAYWPMVRESKKLKISIWDEGCHNPFHLTHLLSGFSEWHFRVSQGAEKAIKYQQEKLIPSLVKIIEAAYSHEREKYAECLQRATKRGENKLKAV